MNQNFENLANAIVLAGVEDYRKALKALSLNPGNLLLEYEVRSIERFFHSSYFKILTELDPEMLLGRLNNQRIIAPKEVAV